MPSHVKVKGSTWNLNLKAVKKVVGRGYVRTFASWLLEKIKWFWMAFIATMSRTK
jgi:hypothetical protein